MTVVKINAITVPADSGDELAHRFAKRAGAVDGADGFEGFELLKPTDDRVQWLVVTRWRDEESFQAWLASPSFAHGHRSAAERSGGEAPQAGLHPQRGVVLRHRRRLHPRLTPPPFVPASSLVQAVAPEPQAGDHHGPRSSCSSRPSYAIRSSAVPVCGAANQSAYSAISARRHSRSNSSTMARSAFTRTP